MRKFWIVLLSISLLMAFTMPVCAADVKFSGSYTAQGYYENNRTFADEKGASFSNVWQRLRVQTVFQIQEGLSLTTRFDAMEKVWGASRNAAVAGVGSGDLTSENENLKFEHVYVSANIAGGLLRVGYQQQSVFGTAFADSGDSTYGPRVRYDYVIGPLTLLALWDKVEGQKAYSTTGPAGVPAQMDSDQNKYDVAFMYNWGKGSAGLLFIFLNDTSTSGVSVVPPASDNGYKRKWYVFDPYVKANFGPIYVEAEALYVTGYTRKYESDSINTNDQKKNSITAYAAVIGTFGPAYVGLAGIYVPGDDDAIDSKDKAGYPAGTDFNPCLMFFNYDLGRWNGAFGKYTTGGSGQIVNARIGQVFGGIKPIPALDVKLSYTYAKADKDPPIANWISKKYGSEVDLTATYKIYDNLSYMIGGGYIFAGDYWMGTNTGAQVKNDYLLTHKLTLTF
jgi:hypothetical protein